METALTDSAETEEEKQKYAIELIRRRAIILLKLLTFFWDSFVFIFRRRQELYNKQSNELRVRRRGLLLEDFDVIAQIGEGGFSKVSGSYIQNATSQSDLSLTIS